MYGKPEIDPNLPDWIVDHMTRYLETDGADGHIWRDVPTLILTTRGRKSGQERSLPLIYGRDGDSYLLVASKGGAPAHPAWYLNLVAEPTVQLQVAADRFLATSRTASAEERSRMWQTMREIWPQYDDYQAKADREIPVVVLDRQ